MVQGKPWVILTQDTEGAATWLPLLAAKGVSARQWPAFEVHPRVPDALHAYFSPGRPPGDALGGAIDERQGLSVSAGLTNTAGADLAGKVPHLGACLSAGASTCHHVYVLTSPAAVRVLANWLRQVRRTWPAGVWAGVPGRGTASVFQAQLGDQVPMILPEPPWQDGEHLARAIVDQVKGAAESRQGAGLAQGGQRPQTSPRPVTGHTARVWVFNRPDGRTHWLKILHQQGMSASVLPIYEVRPVVWPPPGFEAMLAAHRQAADRLHWLLGATAPIQTVSGWLSRLPAEMFDWARRQPVWVPHHRLVAVARSTGFVSIQVYQDRQQLIEQLQ
ncbi:MAG: hypothetical protein Q4D91_00470 [Lautropia sp.]|nr:hypothetical protein [Lautropia sp.]